MTGHDALSGLPLVAFSLALRGLHLTSSWLNSKRISDLLVGVKHHSDGVAHGARGEVLHELAANETTLAVGGGDLAPDGLVVDASLGVLLLVNESNALAVVEGGRLAVLAVLDSDQSGVLFLGALASLEAGEDALGVKSAASVRTGTKTYLIGSLVILDFDFVSMSTFNLIFMY